MDTPYIATVIDHLRRKDIPLEHGLTDAEVARAEAAYHFTFPPDLRQLLQTALPVGPRFPHWRSAPSEALDQSLQWPADGMCFDIEHNVFWLESWGERPEALADACALARRHVSEAPVLVPVYSHRYMPAEPHLVGNPVFSVYQTDIIYYGYDLAGYLAAEFDAPRPVWAATSPRPIRFWDLLVS